MAITVTINVDGREIVATRTHKTVDRRDPTSSITWKSDEFELTEIWGMITGRFGSLKLTEYDSNDEFFYDVKRMFYSLEDIINSVRYLE